MIKLNVRINIDGEIRESKETFKACGINWVRYKKSNDSNGYATLQEWKQWLEIGTIDGRNR